MDLDAEIRWLKQELAKHEGGCYCRDCAAALAELRHLGVDPDETERDA